MIIWLYPTLKSIRIKRKLTSKLKIIHLEKIKINNVKWQRQVIGLLLGGRKGCSLIQTMSPPCKVKMFKKKLHWFQKEGKS